MTQHLIADDQNAKQIIAQREATAAAAMIQATNQPYQPPRPRMGYPY